MSKYIIFNEVDEEWRKLDDYPPYAISSYGRLKNIKTGHLFTGNLDKNGYLKYTLRTTNCDNKNGYTRTAHSLVAATFLGKRPEGRVIDHIDRDKRNNHYTNLRYVSVSENAINTDKIKEKRNKKLSYKKTAVIFYDKFDCVIGEFENIIIASERTGFRKEEICSNIHGNRKCFKNGCYFKLK